jgi:hypothetical protein
MAETYPQPIVETKFTFPSEASRPSTKVGGSLGGAAIHPRVSFRSYAWTSAKPKLANTKNVDIGGSTSNITLFVPATYSEQFGARWGYEPMVTALVNPGDSNAWLASGAETVQTMANSKFGGFVSAARYHTGTTSFPGEFLVFDRGEPITLTFNFDLLPMNKTEADTIVGMVKTFKTKILPEFNTPTPENFGLKFPDLWRIEVKGMNGTGFPTTEGNFNDMALASCNVTYSGGANSALAFYDGNPVATNLVLTFKSVRNSYIYKG